MILEEKLPDRFKRVSFHPSVFTYAWKKNVLEKLFQEFLASNIGILGGEVWRVEGELILKTIPLKDGKINIFEWKHQIKKEEDWYDFVERSTKETLDIINDWNLERDAHPDHQTRIWYHFSLAEE